MPHDQVPALYRTHDIFVFPSIWQEPFGLTPLEAMASGTPGISTVNGGHGEFIKDRINALVFKEDDAGILAQQVYSLIENDELQQQITATARQMVTKLFSMDRYVNELETFLSESVNRDT